jgi:hypothetical protein
MLRVQGTQPSGKRPVAFDAYLEAMSYMASSISPGAAAASPRGRGDTRLPIDLIESPL